MALEAFLKIEGIPGESRKQGHADEIDILSFSFGAANPTTVGKGTGAGASQVNISSFNIMKATDLASTALFLRCAKGEHIPTAIVTLRKSGGTNPLEYLQYKFTKVYVDSIQWSGSSGGDDTPTESCSLAFEKVEIVYSSQNDDGTAKKTVGSGWDIPSGTPSGVK
jgi:type VI secretion system secreted protein Hcp